MFGRKNYRLFVAILSDFGLFFNYSTHRAEKNAFKEKIIRCTARLGNCSTPKPKVWRSIVVGVTGFKLTISMCSLIR